MADWSDMTNETATLTLTDFVLTRIAEEEALAGAVSRRQRRGWPSTANAAAGAVGHDVGLFILFNNPGRREAQCEALRRIVSQRTCCITPNADQDHCPTLRALALPYADHPDFREEWRA
jgi:hypothetical protein